MGLQLASYLYNEDVYSAQEKTTITGNRDSVTACSKTRVNLHMNGIHSYCLWFGHFSVWKVKYASRPLIAVHSAPTMANWKLLWEAVIRIVLSAPHRQRKKKCINQKYSIFLTTILSSFFLIISNCICTLWYHDDILTSIVPTSNRNCKKNYSS